MQKNVSSVVETSAETGFGEKLVFCEFNSAAALPSTHCLCETVQNSRIKDVQAGVYLARESDDASCVF